jgi:hypothetical protein
MAVRNHARLLAGMAWLIFEAALAGCGGGSAEPATTAATEPTAAKTAGDEQPGAGPAPGVDVAAMFAAEQAEQPVHLIGTPDGKLKARMEATTTPSVAAEDGLIIITAPNGPSAIQCFVSPARKDTAEVLRLLADGTLGKAAPDHRWVDVHGDQAGGWPYVVARAHYVVETPKGRLAGDFKIASSARGETTVACLYDAPGHYASFERALRGLLETLDTAENRALPKALKSEITRTRLDGRMVSVSLNETRKDGKAEVFESFDAMLTLGPEGTLASSDSAKTETYRKGRLESATYAQSKHGEMDYQLELSSKKDAYSVTGTVQDKPFTAEFTVAGGLPDSDRSDAAACVVHRGKKPSSEIVGYVPDADPSAPTPMRFEKSSDPTNHLRVSLGKTQGLLMDVKVDADCAMESGIMRAGEVAIEIERLWIEKRRK